LNFILEVEQAGIADDTIISETDISMIEQAIELAERVPEIIQECEQYVIDSGNNAVQSEKWAAGTANGTPVTSGDTTYHNNSKYYAEQAATSETNASNSATSAAADAARVETMANTSEKWAVGQVNGVDVPTTDETYHNNSKFYATQAGTSASNAATSANNASNSENAAKLAEQNAKASEEILDYYTRFTLPRFIIQNNRLYISEAADGEFIVSNNRLYIKNPD
jgi:hypothetical protein